jgi:UDP-N-acetylglucosamine 2-epimerase (non-hydrolysing)
MKVMTILGTRPEIIRLSRIVPLLDDLCEHVLVHTGQNFDRQLSDVFFEELGLRSADHHLGIRADTVGEQMGRILIESEALLRKFKPDRVLILGDTNSGLAAVMAKRMGIPVYHMEAGNRCYDHKVPEEVNRKIIDHCSDVWLPYTERSRANLLAEGLPAHKIYVTGNPIFEVLEHYKPKIDASNALKTLGLEAGGFMLATFHRAENVDAPDRLGQLVEGFERIHRQHEIPVIVSTHPRTREKLAARGGAASKGVRFLEPFGFFDFVKLEKTARCVLSDSGTVQEEAAILGVPSVTVRDVTERPETLECGSNILSGVNADAILAAVRQVLAMPTGTRAPAEYLVPCVSGTVAKIVLGRS